MIYQRFMPRSRTPAAGNCSRGVGKETLPAKTDLSGSYFLKQEPSFIRDLPPKFQSFPRCPFQLARTRAPIAFHHRHLVISRSRVGAIRFCPRTKMAMVRTEAWRSKETGNQISPWQIEDDLKFVACRVAKKKRRTGVYYQIADN